MFIINFAGLISSEDVDKLESCLVVAEPLIRAHSEHAQEVILPDSVNDEVRIMTMSMSNCEIN